MNDENEIELGDHSGIWSIPGVYSCRPLTLSEKVNMAISDEHSYKKSEQIALNVKLDKPRNHGVPWYPELCKLLKDAYQNGATIPELARDFERTELAIRMKLESMGFEVVTPVGYNPTDQALPQQSVNDHLVTGHDPNLEPGVHMPQFGELVLKLYGS